MTVLFMRLQMSVTCGIMVKTLMQDTASGTKSKLLIRSRNLKIKIASKKMCKNSKIQRTNTKAKTKCKPIGAKYKSKQSKNQ